MVELENERAARVRYAMVDALLEQGWTVDSAFAHVDGTCDRELCCGWDEGPAGKRAEIATTILTYLDRTGVLLNTEQLAVERATSD